MSNSLKAVQVARGMSHSLCVVLLLLTCCALAAQTEQPRVRNIVLVHGAWADGSGWKGVYDILVKDGYNVSIVQGASHSVYVSRPKEVAAVIEEAAYHAR